jgi:[ribosomal protein S5]-alanine N-acetyltransferase
MITKIETARLLLRTIAMSDAEKINELSNDKAVAARTLRMPYPCSLEDTKKFIEQTTAQVNSNHSMVLTITLKSTSEIIGVISLQIESQHESGELGYWLGKKYWGNGYGTEAAKAVIHYGFEHYNLNRIYACCMSDNEASGKVLRKVGMQYEGFSKKHIKRDGVFKDIEHYAILKLIQDE